MLVCTPFPLHTARLKNDPKWGPAKTALIFLRRNIGKRTIFQKVFTAPQGEQLCAFLGSSYFEFGRNRQQAILSLGEIADKQF